MTSCIHGAAAAAKELLKALMVRWGKGGRTDKIQDNLTLEAQLGSNQMQGRLAKSTHTVC